MVDPHDNTITYYYAKETNNYTRYLQTSGGTKYVSGGYLSRVDYGSRKGSSYSKNATARVRFGVENRSDLPDDRICADGDACGIGGAGESLDRGAVVVARPPGLGGAPLRVPPRTASRTRGRCTATTPRLELLRGLTNMVSLERLGGLRRKLKRAPGLLRLGIPVLMDRSPRARGAGARPRRPLTDCDTVASGGAMGSSRVRMVVTGRRGRFRSAP
ncbi:hypothetical protein AB0L06_30625 [Spirillospora sp. NPDC052269]